MTLDADGLETDLAALFASPPLTVVDGEVDYITTIDDCADAWASAMSDYAASIVPASTTVGAAAAALKTSLKTLFGTTGTAADKATAFDAAMGAFALAVGGGMAGFTATSPTGATLASSTLLSANARSHAAAATSWKNAIHNWMTTGTATPLPSGSAVNWS